MNDKPNENRNLETIKTNNLPDPLDIDLPDPWADLPDMASLDFPDPLKSLDDLPDQFGDLTFLDENEED